MGVGALIIPPFYTWGRLGPGRSNSWPSAHPANATAGTQWRVRQVFSRLPIHTRRASLASSAARPRLREASVLAARTAPGHRRSREAPDRDARRADDFSAGHGIRQWGAGYLGFGPQVFLIPQSVLLTSGPHRLPLAPGSSHNSWLWDLPHHALF